MSKSHESWNKKEKENLRKKKRDEKAKRKTERKSASKEKGKTSFEDMIAYVDENGRLTSVEPDRKKKKAEIELDQIVISIAPREEESEQDTVHTGVVKFFNNDKGYGFIKGASGSEQYFVHVNDILEPITENDAVEFEVEDAERGKKAVRVRKKPTVTEPQPEG